MPKSKIIKELANNEISLEVALNRLYVLANDLDNDEIKVWTDKELYGYLKDDNLPAYRIFKSCDLVYSGINGQYQVTNQPLSLTWLDVKTVESLSKHKITAPIKEVERNAAATSRLYSDVSYLAGEVAKNTQDGWIDGVQCFSINQVFSPSQFDRIITNVKGIALKLLLELDSKFGCLDNLDIGSEKISEKERKSLLENISIVFNDYSIDGQKIKFKDAIQGNENSQVKNKESTKINDSNIGSGSNMSEKSLSLPININNKSSKKGFLRRLFRK